MPTENENADPTTGDQDKPKVGDTKPTGDGPKPEGKTYTQAEVDALDIKQQKRYAAAGQKKLLEDLGIESADEIKALVEAKKASEEATKSEAQKALDAALKAQAEAEAAKAEAQTETMKGRLATALLASTGEGDNVLPGVDPTLLEGAMTIALVAAQSSSADNLDEKIAEAVEETRKKAPVLFGSTSAGGKPPTSQGTPKRPSSQHANGANSTKDAETAFKDWKKNGQRRLTPLPGSSDT